MSLPLISLKGSRTFASYELSKFINDQMRAESQINKVILHCLIIIGEVVLLLRLLISRTPVLRNKYASIGKIHRKLIGRRKLYLKSMMAEVVMDFEKSKSPFLSEAPARSSYSSGSLAWTYRAKYLRNR